MREAIAEHRKRLDADTAVYLHDEEAQLEAEVLQASAGYLAVAPEEIALTTSTTMGLGLLYATLALEPTEEILTTEHDFFSTHDALRLRARRTGAVVRRVRLYDEPATVSEDAVETALLDAVTPRTRAVPLTWVHSSTGVKLPVRALADALGERDAELGKRKTLLCVDAVHGFGVEPESPGELGCDFLVSGCHKWLFVPGAAEPEAFVRRLLDEHGVVASLTPYATRYLRFGPSIANSEDEVDRAVEAVRALARR